MSHHSDVTGGGYCTVTQGGIRGSMTTAQRGMFQFAFGESNKPSMKSNMVQHHAKNQHKLIVLFVKLILPVYTYHHQQVYTVVNARRRATWRRSVLEIQRSVY